MIVRFSNRVIRDMIYDNKRHLRNHNVSITEHLTDCNRDLLDGAKELLGFKNVWTRSCRVYGLVGGKKISIDSIESLKDTVLDADANPDKYVRDGPPRKTHFQRFTDPAQQQLMTYPEPDWKVLPFWAINLA